MKILLPGDRLSVAESIGEALDRGERHFVAAGGDGTVNLLLNTLLALKPERETGLAVGAIALGSSNDFHKPVQPWQCTGGISCKIDFSAATPRDVVHVSYSGKGGEACRFFLINASAGLTAEANAFFNNTDRLLGWLKQRYTDPAILYAAIRTILRYRNEEMTLTFPDAEAATVPGHESWHCAESPFFRRTQLRRRTASAEWNDGRTPVLRHGNSRKAAAPGRSGQREI